MDAPTQDDLNEVMDKHPYLTSVGLQVHKPRSKSQEEYDTEFQSYRQRLQNSLRQVQLCCEWISKCRQIKTVNRKIGSSYTLKHKVEKYFGEYIPAGAFVAAILYMGVPYKDYNDSPNIHVALSAHLPELQQEVKV